MDLVPFWGRKPVRDPTKDECKILRKMEQKTEKIGECFLHPRTVYFNPNRVPVRGFVFDLFNGEVITTNNQKIYVKCDTEKCINPAHLVRTTFSMNKRLHTIGWTHFGKSKKEIRRLFELQTLLQKGKCDDVTGCLLYTGRLEPDGYGKSKSRYVHRHRWQLENPKFTLRPNVYVRHKCPNKSCFAIDHLEIGTSRENAKDKRRDGTQQFGENHHKAKLTKENAQKIKDNIDDETARVRADRYNVSRKTVERYVASMKEKYQCYTLFQLGEAISANNLSQLLSPIKDVINNSA